MSVPPPSICRAPLNMSIVYALLVSVPTLYIFTPSICKRGTDFMQSRGGQYVRRQAVCKRRDKQYVTRYGQCIIEDRQYLGGDISSEMMNSI